MAMRAVLKKLSPPSNIRFLGGRQFFLPYSGGGSSRRGDSRKYISDNKEIIHSAEETEYWRESKKEIKEMLDVRMTKLCREYKEEERQRFLEELEWMHLNFFLHLSGFQTRQLLSMKPDHGTVFGKIGREGIVRFAAPSFGKGLKGTKLLVLDHGSPYGLPRQTVNGLVCITAWDKEKFLIHNPSTGETSPWIKTTVASERMKSGEITRQVDCIAFGFDPTNNEHKVVCVSSALSGCINVAQQDNNNAIQVEVLTIDRHTWTGACGTNIWRIPRDCSKDGLGFRLVDPPVYVNGCIYWLHRPVVGTTRMLEFSVQREEFQYYSVSPFLDKKGAAAPPTFQLMEFDGCVGILKRISDYEACAYVFSKLERMRIYYFDEDDEEKECCDRIEEENISLPYAWTAGAHLSVEGLTGTNILLIQPESSDSVFCYDRKTKQSVRFHVLDDYERIMQL